MIREIVLDTETTGLDPLEGHKIIEIAAIELIDHIQTEEKFHFYLNPEREIPEASQKIHNISNEMVKDKPKFGEIYKNFLDFIKGDSLVIHNAEFDLAHLNHELEILGMNKIDNKVTDTLILAREKYPGSSISLDALCKRYRIDNSRRKKHTALIDCDLLSKVYINLIDQKEPTLNFQNIDQHNLENRDLNINYFKKVVKPNDKELMEHKIYLKENLKKNFFN